MKTKPTQLLLQRSLTYNRSGKKESTSSLLPLADAGIVSVVHSRCKSEHVNITEGRGTLAGGRTKSQLLSVARSRTPDYN